LESYGRAFKRFESVREEFRTIEAGSRMRKAEPPPEICADLKEGVIRGKLRR